MKKPSRDAIARDEERARRTDYRFCFSFARMRASSRASHSNSGRGIVNLDGQLQEVIDELLSHGISLDLAKKEFEKKYIVGAVKRSSGNLGRAASSLGIHRNTLRNKVGILNIRLPREKFRVSPDITKKK
jgi:Fis family transcriptional regulator, factor for inversion stimulation protein